MRQTLLFIPPDWLTPLLIGWLVIGAIALGYIATRKGVQGDFWSSMMLFVVGALVIRFLIPQIMVRDPDTNQLLGIPIRGYGFFLLLAVISGVLLAIYRARRLGMHPDIMLNLCFWIFGSGIVGARLFYVIQYRQDFESFADVINMTQGGLVVFGSLIGSLMAVAIYSRVYRISMFLTMDVLAPCMMIGLSIGRIGCLMNGCCWGGICEVNLPTISFPEGSPPYARQVETGELFGMRAPPVQEGSEDELREIVTVQPGSVADQLKIESGTSIENYAYSANPNDDRKPDQIIYRIRDPKGSRNIVIPQEQIPWRSLDVHPSQIYSSINAFLVFLFLWFYFPYRRRDGEVIALLLIIYPVGRFLLEFIRADEMGQFGTGFTISQIGSMGSIIAGFALLIWGFQSLSRTEGFEFEARSTGRESS